MNAPIDTLGDRAGGRGRHAWPSTRTRAERDDAAAAAALADLVRRGRHRREPDRTDGRVRAARCTEGEIVSALITVFGDYRETPALLIDPTARDPRLDARARSAIYKVVGIAMSCNCNELLRRRTSVHGEAQVHIPDGFINAGVSAAAGVVAAGGIGYSLDKAKETLSEKQAPMAGLVAAFIFAVQMLNFPVAAGTSGHLLGGVLAAVLVGPWAGAVASRSSCWCRRCFRRRRPDRARPQRRQHGARSRRSAATRSSG